VRDQITESRVSARESSYRTKEDVVTEYTEGWHKRVENVEAKEKRIQSVRRDAGTNYRVYEGRAEESTEYTEAAQVEQSIKCTKAG
jgi:hypothetical protein